MPERAEPNSNDLDGVGRTLEPGRAEGCLHITLISPSVTNENPHPIHRCEDCGHVVINTGGVEDEGSGGAW